MESISKVKRDLSVDNKLDFAGRIISWSTVLFLLIAEFCFLGLLNLLIKLHFLQLSKKLP